MQVEWWGYSEVLGTIRATCSNCIHLSSGAVESLKHLPHALAPAGTPSHLVKLSVPDIFPKFATSAFCRKLWHTTTKKVIKWSEKHDKM